MPSTLNTIVSMLLNGADLNYQDSVDSQAILTISQTILFNFRKRPPSATNWQGTTIATLPWNEDSHRDKIYIERSLHSCMTWVSV